MEKLLKALLSGLLVIGNTNLIFAEEDQASDSEETILEMHEIDPETVTVHTLGESDDEPEPVEEAQPYSLSDTVRVSIVLDEASAMDAGYSLDNIAEDEAADAYRNQLKAQQKHVTDMINAVVSSPIEVKWNLTLTVNIISANVKYGDIEKIRRVEGVKDVFIENTYEACDEEINTSNTAQYMVGAADAWADGYTGAGSRIAIIDTGIDTSHQSFSADAFDYSIAELRSLGKTVNLMTSSDVSAVKSKLNGSSGTYRTTKIPFGYNYVDNSSTITHLNDTQGEHGSHVAGIAAANRYIKSGNNYVEAASSVKAVGMAPDAQLLVMKVFGRGGGASDSDYMAAIEDAIILGCDTVNLSLGSQTQGFTFSNGYQSVMNKLSSSSNLKMVTTISAGNSGAFTDELETDLYAGDVYMHTGGEPGTFINSLCTASADNTWSTGTPLTFNGNQTVYYMETDSSGAAMTSVAGTYSYVYIDGVGNTAEYKAVNSAVSLSGKIVIVNRGDLSFYEKGNNLKTYSPKGLIVANNVSGAAISMALDDYTGTFPMVSITLDDALKIKNNSTSHTTGSYTYYTGTVTVSSQISTGKDKEREDTEISTFSSWGVPGSLIMKPEIAAPGGNIYSVFGTNKTDSGTSGGTDQYELMSGTSMAAPHMSGLAGVVAQYVREKGIAVNGYSTRAVIQSLLMSTATPMKNNGEYVSILQQGAGLAEVSRAVRSDSIIMMDSNDGTLTAMTGSAADGKVKAEIGDNPGKQNPYTFSFTVYNIGDQETEYTLDTDLFTQALYEEGNDVFMSPTTTSDVIGDWNVSYYWEGMTIAGYDVNRDGQTNGADVNAILEYAAHKAAGAAYAIDEEAADLDGDNKVTTNDAYELAKWLEDDHPVASNLTVPANGSKKVTVTINPDHALDQYPAGAYVEGFTYVRSSYVTGEGEKKEDEHSIPILGFYGSWTDPSMFDNTSYTDTLYGTAKTPYSGKTATNYMTIGGSSTKFTGNPYMTEDTFPADRLAIKSSSKIYSIYYNLVRSAGTTALAASKTSGIGGDVTQVLYTGTVSNNVQGMYYYESTSSSQWMNTSTKNISLSKSPSDLGLSEGDTFRVGFYAIPEYNALLVNSSATSAASGKLTSETLKNVLLSNVLGDGAFIGYDFTVDNTAPVIEEVAKSGNSIRVKASDNVNLAYISIQSQSGTVYAQTAPGSKEFDGYLTASNIPSTAVVVAADYAQNTKTVSVNTTSSVSEETEAVQPEETVSEVSESTADEVIETVEEEIVEEAATEEDTIEEIPSGSLNSIRTYQPVLNKTVLSENEGDTVTVTIRDDADAVHNGLYKVTYNSDLLDYNNAETNSAYNAVYDVEGAVYVALADVTAAQAGSDIAELIFSKPNTITKVTVSTLEKNEDLAIEDESTEISVGAEDHIYIDSASLSLKDKIDVNFYIYVPSDEVDSTYINVSFKGENTSKLAADYTPKTRNGRLCRFISVPTFAKQMRDEITITVTDKESGDPKYLEYRGEDKTDGFVYKVEDYVKAVEENSDDEDLKDLVHKMDNYGKYAQTQFNYNLGSFDEAEKIENFDDSVLEQYAIKKDGTVEGLTYTNGSLELESDTGIRLYYIVESGHDISEYTFEVDGATVTPVKKSGRKYYVAIKGIAARQMNEVHTVTVTDGSNNKITVEYSGLSYPAAVVTNDAAPATLKDLCRSIYLYWEAAYNYFN